MPAEATHELGRKGTIAAKDLLWRVLGEGVKLPFNAYDHSAKLSFDSKDYGIGKFNFDLRGHLTRRQPSVVSGEETVEVFVEVKNYSTGDSLLAEYEAFLQRAAFTGSLDQHKDTRFIFLCNVPFGTTKGTTLCNGEFLKECSKAWTDKLKPLADGVQGRIILIIATGSFSTLVQQWGAKRLD